MVNFEEDKIERFVAILRKAFENNYGNSGGEYGQIIGWTGRLALENIANSDMLYHDVDHTIHVSLVGQEILRGKHLTEGGVSPDQWLHFMIAVLCHDIGYVRGICRRDRPGVYATGIDDQVVELGLEGSDAMLTPYHVDRSKLFVRERFSKARLQIDIDLINAYIEKTRFGPMEDTPADLYDYPMLTKAADFIGQLGDPSYLRKIPALYYEFEEQGINQRIGYKSPGDMRHAYAKFFWEQVHQHIEGGMHYLRITQVGKQYLANLFAHVFAVEHDFDAETARRAPD
jgi:hypothetical protein